MNIMSVTLDVSKLDKFRLVKEVHLLNINRMETVFEVSKLDKFNSVREEHPKNIEFM